MELVERVFGILWQSHVGHCHANAQTVAVGVHQLYFSTPGLLTDLGVELGSDRFDVVDSKINEGVRCCITGMLRKEEPTPAIAGHRHERWKPWLKSMFPLLHVSQPPVPFDGSDGF
jgi:hypothetical protein